MTSPLPLNGTNGNTQQDVSGGEQKIGQLLDAHRPDAYNLAYRLLGEPEDAADAVQDAFLRAVRAMQGDSAAPREPERFRSWLSRIVSNVAIDRLRQHARAATEPLDDLEWAIPAGDRGQPAYELDRREQRGSIMRALLALPPAQRVALTLREYQGLSYEEIGKELGLTQAATTMLLFRARASFRAAYEGATADTEPVGCPELAPLLSALIDGELYRDAWQSIDRHLQRCIRCRRELRNLRRSRRLYAAIPLLAPPAGWCYAAMTGTATVQAAGMVAASTAAGTAVAPAVGAGTGVGTASAIGSIASTVGSFISGKAAAVAVAAGVTVAATVTPAATERSLATAMEAVEPSSARVSSASRMDFAVPSDVPDLAPIAVAAVGASISPLADAATGPASGPVAGAADAGQADTVAPPISAAPAPPPSTESAVTSGTAAPDAVTPAPADRKDRVDASRADDGPKSPEPSDLAAPVSSPGQAEDGGQGKADTPANASSPGQEEAEQEKTGKAQAARENNEDKEEAGGGQHRAPGRPPWSGPPEHANGPPVHPSGPPGHVNAAPKRQPPGQARGGPSAPGLDERESPGQAATHVSGAPPPKEKPAHGSPHEPDDAPPGRSAGGPPGGPPDLSPAGPPRELPGPSSHGPDEGAPGMPPSAPTRPRSPAAPPGPPTSNGQPGPSPSNSGNGPAPAAQPAAEKNAPAPPKPPAEQNVPAPPKPPAEQAPPKKSKPPAQKSPSVEPKQPTRPSAGSSGSESKPKPPKPASSNAPKPPKTP